MGVLLGRPRRLVVAELRKYLRAVEAAGTAINIAPLVGHGALRIGAMGYAERARHASASST